VTRPRAPVSASIVTATIIFDLILWLSILWMIFGRTY